ncbi:MAG: ribonuclease III [Bacteroidetes bacterium]|nr:ribonuclease III [Bacteroidota bacterium]MCB9225888.1 ribonuclease III [Chitinophagales bacterium]
MNFFEKIKGLFSTHRKDEFHQFIYRTTGVFPQNIDYYVMAFRHKSLHKSKNYERLEFLGDSVLDTVVSELIYKKFPTKKEGELSKIRSKLVSRNVLNELSEKLYLHEHCQCDKKLNLDTFENLGGNVLEALIGAIYLDKGFAQTKTFILEKIIANHVDWEEILNTKDYKSLLLSKSQQKNFDMKYKVLKEIPEDYKNRFTVGLYINGNKKHEAQGSTIKNAEQKVSEMYLKS